MSDINPNRMIPLHVADQAVAACDKEIAQLRADVAKSDQAVWTLSVENARLKAEVKRLTNCKSEADRLKAEVERLRAGSFVTAVPSEHYERVIKAGDAMLGDYRETGVIFPPSQEAWLAAKEGKPSV